MKTISYVVAASLSLAVILTASTTSSLTWAAGISESVSNDRIEDATRLKEGADAYVNEARAFHERVGMQILEAEKLEGEARFLQNQLQVTPNTKMTPTQYAHASEAYKTDVGQFLGHAETYNLHMENFDREMGQCHANEDAYMATLKKYEMHIENFHVPNLRLPSEAMKVMPSIRPPHICGRMRVSQGQADSIANQYLNDQLRLLSAEQKLGNAEEQLTTASAGAPVVNAKLESEILRAKREQELAAEFGKLKEEYDLLMTERQRIASASKGISSSSSTTVTHVQGKIKNSP